MEKKPPTWEEVMALAEKGKFIVRAAGGTAILVCHEVQKEQGIYDRVQKMNEKREN